MSSIILPGKYTQQPQVLGPIDGANPISAGLADAWLGSNPLYHAAYGSPQLLTPTSGPTRIISPSGVGQTFDGSTQYYSRTAATLTNTVEGTLLVICNPASATSTTRSIFGYGNSASANALFFIGQGASSGQLSFFARSDANTSQNLQVAGPASWANGVSAVLVGTRSESKNYHRIYINGQTQSPTTATALGTTTLNRTTIGALVRNSASLFWSGSVYLALSWNRALDDSEVVEISRNPWQIFRAPSRRIWVASSGSGSTGTVATTNADDSATASGSTTITGTLAKTNSNDSATASGSTTITGSLAKTNANDSCTANGAVGSAITGTVATTNANDSVSASGTTAIVGTSSTTNANDSVAASGVAGAVTGTVAYSNANDSVVSSGVSGSVTGSSAYTNRNDSISSAGAAGDTNTIGAAGRSNYHGLAKDYLERFRKQDEKEREKERLEQIAQEEAEQQGTLQSDDIVKPVKKIVKVEQEFDYKEAIGNARLSLKQEAKARKIEAKRLRDIEETAQLMRVAQQIEIERLEILQRDEDEAIAILLLM